jgi:transposase
MSTRRSGKKPQVPTSTVDAKQVDALLRKLRAGQGLAGTEAQLLADIVESWAHLSERAKRFDLSMADLRRMLGVLGRPPGGGGGGGGGDGNEGNQGGGSSTSGGSGILPGLPGGSSLAPATPPDADGAQHRDASKDDEPASKPKRNEHGRRGAESFSNLPTAHHTHNGLGIGCLCPICLRGKLYRFWPRTFVNIAGQAPFVGSQHHVDRLQCNVCKEIIEAPLPDALRDDGVGEGRLYSYSAHSMVVLLKFIGVMPWHRQQTLQAAVGVTVPDASMSDMCEVVANIGQPVVHELRRLAAQAPLLYGDDTGAAIFGVESEIKEERRTGKQVERTGCHVSAIIARLPGGQHAAILRIGIQHTGEFLDEILAARSCDLPPPMIMGDASSTNTVTVLKTEMCGCNSHAIRRFKELEEQYPQEVAPLLETYRAIFKHDAKTKDDAMTDAQRLAYHRTHSRPLFKDMCREALRLFEQHIVEPNSNLGGALDYLLNHQRALGAFYRLPGAPMCNNLLERELRLPVRLRDAAPLFRSRAGAAIAASLWTLCITALLNEVNVFEYLGCLQRFADDVRAHPDKWLPWNYQQRVDTMTANEARASPPISAPRVAALQV